MLFHINQSVRVKNILSDCSTYEDDFDARYRFIQETPDGLDNPIVQDNDKRETNQQTGHCRPHHQLGQRPLWSPTLFGLQIQFFVS